MEKNLSRGWLKAQKDFKLTRNDVEMAIELKMQPGDFRSRKRRHSRYSATEWIRYRYAQMLERHAEDLFYQQNPPQPNELSPEATRHCRLRSCSEILGADFNRIDGVEKVVLFGSVAEPLRQDPPRCTRDGRPGVSVWHVCADIDLAVWITDLRSLPLLEKATCEFVEADPSDNLTRDHVDLFILDRVEQRYLGRLKSPGVLCQYEGFVFDMAQLDGPFTKVLAEGWRNGDWDFDDVPF